MCRQRKSFCALLVDLAKVTDHLSHKLLAANLNASSFNVPGLRLIHDYLPERKQRIKIKNTYSTWMVIMFGVTQVSILRSLLFNIFLADLLFIIGNIYTASYADDNTQYIVADNIDDLIKSLDKAFTALF